MIIIIISSNSINGNICSIHRHLPESTSEKEFITTNKDNILVS